MAILRACSYQATIELPEPPENYTAILVTLSQEGVTIEKDQSSLTFDGNNVIFKLDQTETKQLAACKKAFMQVRCYKSQYEAPGSKVWVLDVCASLNEDVLPRSEEEVTP